MFNKPTHVIQMAWAKTTKVGCGVTWCAAKGWTYVVCMYDES